jgi:hypothetical protein
VVLFSFSFGLPVPPVALPTELAAALTVELAGDFERGVRVVVLAFVPGPVLVEPPLTFKLSALETDPTVGHGHNSATASPCHGAVSGAGRGRTGIT